MSVSLATAADVEPLQGMLARMGQLWSETAVREATVAPWITVIHLTDGVADGFYCGLVNVALKQTLIGPGDAPHDSHQVWLKAICEMGLAIEDELVRRFPKENITKWWTLTRIWPSMGPLRDFLEVQFNWVASADAGPASGKEGYTEDATGGRTYWVKRHNLVARAKQVMVALG